MSIKEYFKDAESIDNLMNRLAELRPVFHNEADFQFALAWLIKSEICPSWEVRLEMALPERSEGREYADIIIMDEKDYVILELKYKTIESTYACNGEEFVLCNQSAEDLGTYDTWKDVTRIERLQRQEVQGREFCLGAVILLTNDRSYYKKKSNECFLKDYWLIDEEPCKQIGGRGVLKYYNRKRREYQDIIPDSLEGRKPLEVKKTYSIKWNDYGNLQNETNSQMRFRYVSFVVTK